MSFVLNNPNNFFWPWNNFFSFWNLVLAFNYRHSKPPFFNENASDYSYEENWGFTLNTHILWKNKKSVDKNNSVNDIGKVCCYCGLKPSLVRHL